MQSSLFKIIKNHNFTTLIKIINYSFPPLDTGRNFTTVTEYLAPFFIID